MTEDGRSTERGESLAAETARADAARADKRDRAGAEADGAPVTASDPRSLTIDRGGQESASPGARSDEAAAAGRQGS
jgi:hypothetical protein